MEEPARMLQMLYGGLRTQLLCVAAELSLPDLVASRPRAVSELAAVTGTDPSALHRLLRALAAEGVFTEVSPGTFGSTPLASALGSLRAVARLVGAPETHTTLAALDHSVRTGKPAFDHVYGMDWWSYLAGNPDFAETFHTAMGNAAERARAAAVAACDLAGRRLLVDVGGGHGHLTAALLQRHPDLSAMVFDRQDVVAGAGRVLKEAGVAGRCVAVGGDFFHAVPTGGDIYLLSWILHDWDDDEALRILASVGRAMRPGSEIVVLDTVLPEGDQPHPGKLLDIVMLAQHTGRERTEVEFVDLLETAGFTHVRTTALPHEPTGVIVGTWNGPP